MSSLRSNICPTARLLLFSIQLKPCYNTVDTLGQRLPPKTNCVDIQAFQQLPIRPPLPPPHFANNSTLISGRIFSKQNLANNVVIVTTDNSTTKSIVTTSDSISSSNTYYNQPNVKQLLLLRQKSSTTSMLETGYIPNTNLKITAIKAIFKSTSNALNSFTALYKSNHHLNHSNNNNKLHNPNHHNNQQHWNNYDRPPEMPSPPVPISHTQISSLPPIPPRRQLQQQQHNSKILPTSDVSNSGVSDGNHSVGILSQTVVTTAAAVVSSNLNRLEHSCWLDNAKTTPLTSTSLVNNKNNIITSTSTITPSTTSISKTGTTTRCLMGRSVIAPITVPIPAPRLKNREKERIKEVFCASSLSFYRPIQQQRLLTTTVLTNNLHYYYHALITLNININFN